jgi:enoyl-CoA hydratase/carnithine racemase
MTYRNFKFDIDADGIATVTWDMPDRSMNVINLTVIEELSAIVEKVAGDAAIKGAVITGGKDTFCAGARKAASSRCSIGGSRPAASRGSPPSTGRRSVADSNSALPAIIASPRPTPRLDWACPR